MGVAPVNPNHLPMERDAMKRVLAGLMSAFAIATFATATVEAQTQCPPEVTKAKEQLNMRTAKADTVQAPRSLAGARQEAPRGQDIQAPRGQDVQAPRGQRIEAPRGQDVQAPRGQDVQAPRGQDVQAPRGQDVQAPRSLAGARPIEAPRGQDVQAPRGQDVQAPRGQDVQAPRGQDVQAPRSLAGAKAGSSKAFSLVKEAEAACAKGDMATAKAKAEAAMAVMK